MFFFQTFSQWKMLLQTRSKGYISAAYRYRSIPNTLFKGEVKVPDIWIIEVKIHYTNSEEKGRRRDCDLRRRRLILISCLGTPINDFSINCLYGHTGKEHYKKSHDGNWEKPTRCRWIIRISLVLNELRNCEKVTHSQKWL